MTHVDVSSFASKTNLASLKIEVDKLDIAKLTAALDDLAKLSNAVKNDVVKKTEYNKLVTKVDNIDSKGFISKTKHDTDKSDLEKKISDVDKKIPDTSGLVKEIEMIKLANEIAKVGGLATKPEAAAVENRIPDVSGLVKKIDLNANTKITETEGKILSISGLATNSALTAVENKIPDISGLVKKSRL